MRKEYEMMSIKLPKGIIYARTEVTEDGFKVFCIEENVTEENAKTKSDENSLENVFKWIDVNEIKSYDFKKHKINGFEEEAYYYIETALKNYKKDGFYAPIYEPSIDKKGNICYVPDVLPAVNYSAIWWDNKAIEFCPERESSLITDEEYYLIIAYLIKKGSMTFYQAAIDSKGIGHYWNTPASKQVMEKTGRRYCGGFYGFVGNTSKIAKKAGTSEYLLMGGSFDDYGEDYPAIDTSAYVNPEKKSPNSVGIIVLHK